MTTLYVLMNEEQEQEENARRNTERTPDTIANLAEIGGYSTATDSIAQQEHEVRGPAMNLCHVVNSIALRPLLVPIVVRHHSRGNHPRNTYEQGHYQGDQSEDRVWIRLLFPIHVSVNLKTSGYGGCRDEEA